MKELEIQNVYNKCLLDDEDYSSFADKKLWAHKNGHVSFSIGNKKRVYLHRYILRVVDENLVVDHMDGNPFNNQRNNLRICTVAQNSKNLKINCKNTSGYKGVRKQDSKWAAHIIFDNKTYYLGQFPTPELAAEAYDKASKKYHGEFGVTNLELKKRDQVKIEWKPTKFEDANLKPGMVPLGNNEYAYVDLEDYSRVMKHNWHITGKDRNYAKSDIPIKGGYKRIALHNFIMNTPKNLFVDHIDRNPLNNRKENLRLCTFEENSRNRTSQPSKSGYRGVKKANDKWRARISLNKKRIHLGVFDTPELAAQAYNEAAKKHHGEFGILNNIL